MAKRRGIGLQDKFCASERAALNNLILHSGRNSIIAWMLLTSALNTRIEHSDSDAIRSIWIQEGVEAGFLAINSFVNEGIDLSDQDVFGLLAAVDRFEVRVQRPINLDLLAEFRTRIEYLKGAESLAQLARMSSGWRRYYFESACEWRWETGFELLQQHQELLVGTLSALKGDSIAILELQKAVDCLDLRGILSSLESIVFDSPPKRSEGLVSLLAILLESLDQIYEIDNRALVRQRLGE